MVHRWFRDLEVGQKGVQRLGFRVADELGMAEEVIQGLILIGSSWVI